METLSHFKGKSLKRADHASSRSPCPDSSVQPKPSVSPLKGRPLHVQHDSTSLILVATTTKICTR